MSLGTYVIVFITVSNPEEGEKIAKELVEKRIVACVNIVKDIKSFFIWKGKLDTANEALLIIKTRLDKLNDLISIVKSLHSYEIPEIIAIPIIYGYRPYLEWINNVIEGKE